jgi:hypothetical protein
VDSPLIGREVLHILSVLHLIQPPLAFVVVAGDWPGGLVLLLSLDLPIQGAFFPNQLHAKSKFFNHCVTFWRSVAEFQGAEVGDDNVVYTMSGGIDFLWHVLLKLDGCQQVIVMIKAIQNGASRSVLQHVLFGTARHCLRNLVCTHWSLAMPLWMVLWMPNISLGFGWICLPPIFPWLNWVFIVPSGTFWMEVWRGGFQMC